MKNKKKTLNVGLIGYNFMGKVHSNAWRQAPKFFDLPVDIALHTICGRTLKSVQEAAETYGWQQASTDWKDVVNNPEIDIIDVSTPTSSHSEIAIAAANAGKAVICEKPMTMTVEESEAMVKAAKKNKIVNMVCHNYRRIPAIALAKRMIERGDLGDRIYHYRARYAQDWIADPNFPMVWRLDSKIAGLGTLGCIGSHILDLGRYLVGEFDQVLGVMDTFIKQRPIPEEVGKGLTAKGGKKMGKVTVEDAVSWIGRFKNGAMANLEATRFAYGRKNHITFEINGSKGSLAFDFEDMNRLQFYSIEDKEDLRGFRNILVTEPSHPYIDSWWPGGHIIGYEHTFINAFADFIRAIVDGKSVQPTFEDGLRNQIVLQAVYDSAQQGEWVKIKSK